MKITLVIISMLLTLSVMAQRQQAINIFSLGAKAGYGASMLQGDKTDVTLKMAPNAMYYGPKFGFNPIEEIGVVGEYLMFSNSYKLDYKINDSSSVSNTVKVKGTQIPIIARLTIERVVAEAGVSLNSISSTTNSLNGVTDVFDAKHMDLVFGVGQAVANASAFAVSIYGRVNYSLQPWSTNGYPFVKTGDVSNLMVSFGVDLHWKVGYFATSRCGRKTGFLWY